MIKLARKKKAAKRYIPSEIITQIIFRLPCKSLARFRSVSKQWRSCIDDCLFVNEYNEYRRATLNHPSYFLLFSPRSSTTSSSRGLHLYSIGDDSHVYLVSVSVPEQYEAMLSSSCGLVCFHGIQNRSIAVYNPTSREAVTLPDFPEPYKPFEEEDDHHRRNCRNLLGFGFHPQSSKYKAVQLVRDSSTGGISRCHVLTVRRGESCWRAVEASLPSSIGIDGPALCADGVLYWENRLYYDGDFIQIVAFDLSREDLRVILSPTAFDCSKEPYGYFKHLVELQGKICFAEVVCNNGSLQMDISMLKVLDEGFQWDQLYRLELGPYPRGPRSPRYVPFFPLCVLRDRVLLVDDEAMYSYHFKEKRLINYDDGSDGGDNDIFQALRRGGRRVDYVNFHAEAFVSFN